MLPESTITVHYISGKQVSEEQFLSYLKQSALEEGRKQGRREVVEWIENRGGSLDGFRNEWQAQLKEWGIILPK